MYKFTTPRMHKAWQSWERGRLVSQIKSVILIDLIKLSDELLRWVTLAGNIKEIL